MTDFVKKGKYYYRRNVPDRRPYELKKCAQCTQEAFIAPNGKYCSKDCAGRAMGLANSHGGPSVPKKPRNVDYIFAIDPGGARCGYALYEHTGAERDSVLVQSGIVTYDSLTEFLQDYGYVTVVVCESYIIRPGLNHGSSGKTIKAIGQIEMWANSIGKPLYKQRPDILPIAHKITGIPKPKGHLPDDKSAILHGAYWLAGKRWYLSALERGKKAS